MTTETLKNPTVQVISTPTGIDTVIKKLQAELQTIPWLQKSFHRAWTMPRQVLKEKLLEPMVYQGTSEYYPVLPNDALNSYSFWRVNGGRVIEQYAANLNYGGKHMMRDPVDLIVWVDLKKIDPDKNFIFTEELIRDVLNRLNKFSEVLVSRIWDDKAGEIFSGYTLQPNHRDLLMYPYAAFRLEMFLSYEFQC